LIPNLCTADCAVVIYASVLDQPVTYSLAIGSGATEKLQLGVDTNNFGLGLGISNGNIEEYHGKYVDLFSHPVEFATNLRTQLRTAAILFWKWSIAISLTAHVAVDASCRAFCSILPVSVQIRNQKVILPRRF